MAEQILTTEFSEEMQKSYLDYSMSVITSRAVPDIRDGLKPVQRRVLYDMNELHANHDRPTYKSARICGDTMGKYHPHGDSSIYDTLVVMAQDFKRMQPVVHGQGNFGSIEGDSAAAPRYTEAKLEKFTDDCMLADLDTMVPFQPNYDETLREPVVLPARIPYFLLNGSEGIAVGMTTSTPSHNLGEIIDLILAYLRNPAMETADMMQYLKGPDFPTGGIIANKSELVDIYRSGTGRLKLRGKLQFEKKEGRSDRDKLVVTEIPYTMIGQGIMKFMQDVAQLVEDKILPEIVDISNQSDKNGIRIVLELKAGADIERIQNILYKKTRLEDTFGVNMLAIHEGRPETMTLRGILKAYLKFQYEILTNKYQNLLEKELARKEIQDGLIKAVDLIDAIIALLRNSKNQADAKQALMSGEIAGIKFRERDREFMSTIETFHFTERQAQAILDMRLSKLIGLELIELKKQHAETLRNIKEYRGILGSRERMNEVLSEDLMMIRAAYAVPRRTVLEDGKEAVFNENEVQEISCYYIQDKFGYCKLMDEATYQRNQEAVESDNRFVLKCKNTDRVLLFTDKGNMHQIKCQDVPLGKFKDKGVPIDNISKYNANQEEIIYANVKSALAGKTLIFATRDAMVKLVETSEFETANKLVAATKLGEGDRLIEIREMAYETDIVFETHDGYFLRCSLSDIPLQKKNSKGVIGIRLGKCDTLEHFYLLGTEPVEITYRKKPLSLNRLKLAGRAGKGTKH
ncbi:DNA topoisomerase (ATP-hydrolyzing) subunit A [Oribacterium sp. P9]|uniref:DNA gyrase/topoisomerase IV subunit A n=1 Tax=unclassified Oribacterium TaxID=2629782 RepID=UPI002A79006F|nr:DNA gyrase subunit A [Oribacterium sp.]MDY2854878.1 DNA gyrase subunit A [Oliverpabstia sp.]